MSLQASEMKHIWKSKVLSKTEKMGTFHFKIPGGMKYCTVE